MQLFDDDDVVVTLSLRCTAGDVQAAVAICVPAIERLGPVASSARLEPSDTGAWVFDFMFVTSADTNENIDATVRRALAPVLRYFDLSPEHLSYDHVHQQTEIGVDLPRFSRYAVNRLDAEPGRAISRCIDGPADPASGPRWTGELVSCIDQHAVVARLHVGLTATGFAAALVEAADVARDAGALEVLVQPSTGGYAAALLLERPALDTADALAQTARLLIEQHGLHGARFALYDVQEWQIGVCENPWRLGPYALYVRRGMDPLSSAYPPQELAVSSHFDEAASQTLYATLKSLISMHIFVCAEVEGLDGIAARDVVRGLAQRITPHVEPTEPIEISEPYPVDGGRIGVTAVVGSVAFGPELALAAAIDALGRQDWQRPRYDTDGSIYADWHAPAMGADGITSLRVIAGPGTLLAQE
ncbi:hypothetical protein KRM28CT15_15330 [Krasilnikovia sp. M28-CT-15]